MTDLRLARRGAVALASAATLVLVASCGQNALNDDATGGGPPFGTGSGGAPAKSNGGSPPVGNTGGQVANGGSSTWTGGTTGTSTTGGVSTSTGGTSTTGSGGIPGADGGTGTGTSGAGGGTSTCSDLPPNNGDTCAHALEYGWCTQDWLGTSCQRTCGKCSSSSSGSGGSSTGNTGGKSGSTGGTSTGNTGGKSGTGGTTTSTGGTTTATGGSTSGVTVPALSNGTQGRTTRYWDCCKPSCSWTANAQQAGKSSPATSCAKDGSSTVNATTKSACDGGTAYQCNWGVPWEVGSNVSYGYAAFNGSNCGKCYQLDFTGTGDNPGAQSLKGKTLIVQAVNIGDIGANHFDLLIPGGGVGANNGCTGSNGQWGNVSGGAQSGGFLATCGNNMTCITDMCKTAFGSNASLMAGCSWFVGWFAAANNPGVTYAEVPCPADISNRSGLK